MKEVVKELKSDYRANEGKLLSALEMSKEGKTSPFYFFPKDKKDTEGKPIRVTSFGYDNLSAKDKAGLEASGIVEPFEFDDKGRLGYSWVQKSIDFNLDESERDKSADKKEDSAEGKK
jgi:hypothetical protein